MLPQSPNRTAPHRTAPHLIRCKPQPDLRKPPSFRGVMGRFFPPPEALLLPYVVPLPSAFAPHLLATARPQENSTHQGNGHGPLSGFGARKFLMPVIVKAIKNGTLSIPWAKPGGASVRPASTSVNPRYWISSSRCGAEPSQSGRVPRPTGFPAIESSR